MSNKTNKVRNNNNASEEAVIIDSTSEETIKPVIEEAPNFDNLLNRTNTNTNTNTTEQHKTINTETAEMNNTNTNTNTNTNVEIEKTSFFGKLKNSVSGLAQFAPSKRTMRIVGGVAVVAGVAYVGYRNKDAVMGVVSKLPGMGKKAVEVTADVAAGAVEVAGETVTATVELL